MIFHNRLSIYITTLSLLLLACTSVKPRHSAYISPLHIAQKDDVPKSAVIMPFENETSEIDIEALVRKSFYSHFSSKNYRDFELSEVDRALEILQSSSSHSWRDITPSNIGEIFHADFIIYGRVKEFKRFFLGIYSRIELVLELEIIDSKSGDVVWGKAVSKKSHDGGIPFSFFGIIPAALRSGNHMKREKIVELADSISKKLVDQIPDPPSPSQAPFVIEIQVASFLESKRAQKTLKEFEGKGLRPRIETVKLGDHLWHRVLLGPYYSLKEAKKVRNIVARDTPFQPVFIHHNPE